AALRDHCRGGVLLARPDPLRWGVRRRTVPDRLPLLGRARWAFRCSLRERGRGLRGPGEPMKIPKQQAKAHKEAVALARTGGRLWIDERASILDRFHEGAEHM